MVADWQDHVGFVAVDTFDVVDQKRLGQLLSEVDVPAPVVTDLTGDLERVIKVGRKPFWVVTDDAGAVVAAYPWNYQPELDQPTRPVGSLGQTTSSLK